MLQLLTEWQEGYGEKIAFDTSSDLWVTATWGQLHVWQGRQRQYSDSITTAPIGEVLVDEDQPKILASPHWFDLSQRQWFTPPSLWSAMTEGLEGFEGVPGRFSLVHSAWDAARKNLVVFVAYRSSRRFRRPDAWRGPQQRLLLLSPDGILQQVLWEGYQPNGISSIVLTTDWIAAAGKEVWVWSRDEPALLRTLPSPRPAWQLTRALQVSPDVAYLGQIGADGNIALWQIAEWRLQCCWQGHTDEGRVIAFHPYLPVLVTGGWDDTIKLWSLDGQLIFQQAIAGHVEGLAFNPSGDELVVAQGGPQAGLRLYQVDANALERR